MGVSRALVPLGRRGGASRPLGSWPRSISSDQVQTLASTLSTLICPPGPSFHAYQLPFCERSQELTADVLPPPQMPAPTVVATPPTSTEPAIQTADGKAWSYDVFSSVAGLPLLALS